MIPITNKLWLCECSSYGWVSNLKGAVEGARLLADKAGGIGHLRDLIDQLEYEEKARRIAVRKRRAVVEPRKDVA
jgi:hypothetical protein